MATDRPSSRTGGRRVAAVLVAAVLLGSCSAGGPPPGDPSPKADSSDIVDPGIAAFLEEVLPVGSSGSLVAARRGELVHCAGFGTAASGPGMTATCDTVYDLMSMTKQFTAAAIVKLEAMGRLRVTDPISSYFRQVPADKRAITVHHLLTHSAGLVEGLGGDYEPVSREDMVAGALTSKLVSTPGTEYHYSNLGYSLLAAIIEKVSGSTYERFLAQHLFAPAGMRDTGYVLPQWAPGQVAVEYDANGTPLGKPFDHPWAADGPYWNLRGNGGLLSSARDMFRWHLALEGDAVLPRQAKHQLFEPHVPEGTGADTFYGYGWVVQQTDLGVVVGHDGGNLSSYGEMVRLLDEGVMVFWVTNHSQDDAAGWDMTRLAPAVTQGVVQQLLKR